MSIRYLVGIDRDHDGDFRELEEDSSAQVLDLKWRLGMRRAYDSIADYGRAEITMLNRQGVFSPERNHLEIGTRVRISSIDAEQERIHFTGFVSHVAVGGGQWGSVQAVIHLQDIQPWLDDNPVQLAPVGDVTADQVIDRLLDQAIVRRAVIGGYCLIDVPGYSLIDAVNVFPAENISRRLEAGKTRFAYVGDWWRESTSIRQAIHDLAESERGRFYLDSAGEAVFLNRHHTLVTKTLAASFEDDMSGLEYSYGDLRVNRVLLAMTPREVGESGSVVWQLGQAQRIGQGKPFLLKLGLLDDRGEPLGLLELEALQVAFHRRADGSGELISEGVSAEVVQVGFTSVQVQVSNSSFRDVFLTELKVIGKPLYRRDQLEIVFADGPGMHLHGLKQLSLDLPALSDIETAQAFATYELARRKHPSGTVRKLQVSAREHPEAVNLSLFDRIRIGETQTGHDNKEYFIIGEAHHVFGGGTQHEISWTLEPADLTRFVIVDSSRVDDRDEVITPY